jgi:death-on-curing protein
MDQLDLKIRKEYERWASQCNGEDPYVGPNTIGILDVLKAHFLIADYFYQGDEGLGGIGPRDLQLLHSALYRQHVGFGGSVKWTYKFDICATLFFGLIKNHAFHDANKRTAFLVCLYHLQKLGRCADAPQKDFENLTVDIAENQLSKYPRFKTFIKKKIKNPEILFISDFLKRKTRDIDKRFYSVTYQQLKTILNNYGFSLENPHGNTIDIVQLEEKRSLFGFGQKKTVVTKLGQIGFPGWKSQVGKGAIHTSREVTGLIPDKGFDSQTFFKGSDQMQSLVDEYKGPLLRLADK